MSTRRPRSARLLLAQDATSCSRAAPPPRRGLVAAVDASRATTRACSTVSDQEQARREPEEQGRQPLVARGPGREVQGRPHAALRGAPQAGRATAPATACPASGSPPPKARPGVEHAGAHPQGLLEQGHRLVGGKAGASARGAGEARRRPAARGSRGGCWPPRAAAPRERPPPRAGCGRARPAVAREHERGVALVPVHEQAVAAPRARRARAGPASSAPRARARGPGARARASKPSSTGR